MYKSSAGKPQLRYDRISCKIRENVADKNHTYKIAWVKTEKPKTFTPVLHIPKLGENCLKDGNSPFLFLYTMGWNNLEGVYWFVHDNDTETSWNNLPHYTWVNGDHLCGCPVV